MKGYYTKDEIITASEGLSGLIELVKRGDVWQHQYPHGTQASLNVLSYLDFVYESVDFSDIKPGFEYTNIAGGRMKVIRVEDAPDYPMPKRW